MDQKQQQQVNEAAEKFADALKESYQSIADRSVSAQELNAQLTQEFFSDQQPEDPGRGQQGPL